MRAFGVGLIGGSAMLALSACSVNPQTVTPPSEIGEKRLTVGTVQREIQKGMAAAAVAEALGAPNIVTTDEQQARGLDLRPDRDRARVPGRVRVRRTGPDGLCATGGCRHGQPADPDGDREVRRRQTSPRLRVPRVALLREAAMARHPVASAPSPSGTAPPDRMCRPGLADADVAGGHAGTTRDPDQAVRVRGRGADPDDLHSPPPGHGIPDR